MEPFEKATAVIVSIMRTMRRKHSDPREAAKSMTETCSVPTMSVKYSRVRKSLSVALLLCVSAGAQPAAADNGSVWHFEERRTGTASITQAMRDHAAHMEKFYAHVAVHARV